MTISKAVQIDVDFSPEELAQLFAYADSDFQAAFLNELGRLVALPTESHVAKVWWDMQCSALDQSGKVTDLAREALDTLAMCCDPVDAAEEATEWMDRVLQDPEIETAVAEVWGDGP